MTNEADYVEWVEVEGVTKTRQGWMVKKERQVPQQAYATGGIRCPVHLLKNCTVFSLRMRIYPVPHVDFSLLVVIQLSTGRVVFC